jgi:SET domain-containing protein
MSRFPKTVVKQSSIHGEGLFAKENIKAGTLIGMIKGKKTKKDGPHVLWMNADGDYSEGLKVTCSLKYINHSKKPNVAYYDDKSVVAIKDITKDQELTHDYGLDWA